jgi:4'-phosphopantetheinyl transferase
MVALDGLHFNASDSGELVVVALATTEIGVDLEIRRRLRDPWRLARRICTEDELRQLQTVAEDELNDMLLRLWTVKEAALKAVGTGLPGGLRNVDAEVGPRNALRLRRLLGERDGWRLLAADPGSDALCTIVVRVAGERATVHRNWLESAG